jgi:hypothetical protein
MHLMQDILYLINTYPGAAYGCFAAQDFRVEGYSVKQAFGIHSCILLLFYLKFVHGCFPDR